MRQIAYMTGSRADFGLMSPVLDAIRASPRLALTCYATGEHLLPELGTTLAQVVERYPDAHTLAITIEGDSPQAMTQFTGMLMGEIARAFGAARPDLVLVLGDRPEMLAMATACLYLGIPIAHIHGGERTATVDEIARHAITKLAHLHFAATEDAAQRIRQLGEESWRVHVCGAPALDAIRQARLPARTEVLARAGIAGAERFILLTQHPVSESWRSARSEMEEVLAAALSFGIPVVAVHPHADAGGRAMAEAFERKDPLLRTLPSAPYLDFLALEREAAAWVGNSSAALIESPSFGTPVVNVGPRQDGRLRAANVLDAPCERDAIRAALARALEDASFRKLAKSVVNPWGDGRAAERIAHWLEQIPIDAKLLSKRLVY